MYACADPKARQGLARSHDISTRPGRGGGRADSRWSVGSRWQAELQTFIVQAPEGRRLFLELPADHRTGLVSYGMHQDGDEGLEARAGRAGHTHCPSLIVHWLGLAKAAWCSMLAERHIRAVRFDQGTSRDPV